MNPRNRTAWVAFTVSLIFSVAASSVLAQSILSFGSDTELLMVEEAFPATAMMSDASTLEVQFSVQEGYYLYKKKFAFSSDDESVGFGEPNYPESLVVEDEYFGTSHTFRGLTPITIPVTGVKAGKTLNLTVSYQGCADIGVCYPPAEHQLTVDLMGMVGNQSGTVDAALPISGSGSSGSSAGGAVVNSLTDQNASAAAAVNLETSQSEQNRLATLLGSASLWLNAGTFFVLGLLLAFTPCVLPMVPILSSLIIGQGNDITTGKAFRLSLVYVLAMALTYTVVGVLIGLSGVNLQAFFQNPWILSAFALLFVALAAAMFGLYELQLPSFLQNKLNTVANNQKAGSLGGSAVMGFLSALIVGPCVTAPLVGALIYIANTGDALIGGVALFSLGLGMGAPLLLVGTSAGKWLPNSGAWMEKIKQLFGFLLLGLAIYMLTRILPTAITAPMFAVLILMAAVFFGALDSLKPDSGGWQRFSKGASLAAALYGAALLIGTFSGHPDYIAPLRGFAGGGQAGNTTAQTHQELQFTRIKTVADLESALNRAAQQNKSVMLDFYADWCVSCKVIEATVFTDPNVQARLTNTVTIQADVTDNDIEDKALLKHLGVFAPPTIIWFDNNGQEIPEARLVGDNFDATDFATHISRFIGSAV
ncbi:MAG: protein-disulfide reductase DsbD [Gammaproteobacteria bacterium]|nr:protein-disulfide reductase DsbD [Gammaproteobacteria bacterium]